MSLATSAQSAHGFKSRGDAPPVPLLAFRIAVLVTALLLFAATWVVDVSAKAEMGGAYLLLAGLLAVAWRLVYSPQVATRCGGARLAASSGDRPDLVRRRAIRAGRAGADRGAFTEPRQWLSGAMGVDA